MVELGVGTVLLLVVAGFLAGAVNAVAGGGSLISFPALLAVGYPGITANVTNQVAVLPGYVGGSVAYREELRGQGSRTAALAATSVAGAVLGAILLVVSPAEVFDRIVPFLILFSCLLLAAQPAISRRVRPAGGGGETRSVRLHVMQFAGSVYGGYFGAGLGIMLLAVLALSLADTLQRLNALKGLLSLIVGVASVAFFAIFESIAWAPALIMAVTSYAGGQVGVALARRLSAGVLRGLIVVFGIGVALWLFLAG
jgi:uncharacterized membrane protein YfcA